MAAFENYDQVKAAYDALLAKKTKAQRAENVQRQQAVLGVNNYLRQNGYTGGAAESILLRARGNPVDYSAYDTQLADYQAMMKAFQQAAAAAAARGGGGGRGGSVVNVVKPSANAAYNRNDHTLVAGKTAQPIINRYVRMTH